jgi:hypothetical protein
MNLFEVFAWLCILLGAAFGVWRAYQHGWASPLWDHRYRPFGRWRPDPDGRARGRPAE